MIEKGFGCVMGVKKGPNPGGVARESKSHFSSKIDQKWPKHAKISQEMVVFAHFLMHSFLANISKSRPL
jgi:hypothetical protein